MTNQPDSNALTELVNSLADAIVQLELVIYRMPEREHELQKRLETNLKEIQLSRTKVLKLLEESPQ
jgi:hypothetical protein